jgi:NADH-quinone oxidoreductase subunit N
VAVLASVVAFFFYLRIIVAMYMDDPGGEEVVTPDTIRVVMTVAVLVTLVFGIFPGPLLDLAGSAVPL